MDKDPFFLNQRISITGYISGGVLLCRECEGSSPDIPSVRINEHLGALYLVK